MKKIVALILFFIPFSLFGQFNQWFPGQMDYSKTQVNAVFHYDVDALSMTNKFINTYRNGKYIDLETKDKVRDKLKDKNVIGGELGVSLFYRSAADSLKKRGWYAGVTHTSIFESRFTKDLFQLYFYGNKPFAGKTADIGNMSLNQLTYQQLQLGLFQIVDKAACRHVFGFGLGFVNGQDFKKIKTYSSSLYTAADATYLEMDLALEAQHADSADHKFGAFNGSGAAGSLYYQVEKKDNYLITLQIKDIGFIAWNDYSANLVVDTNYYFDGIEVTNLLDSVYLEVKSVDDYKNSFLKENENKKAATILPASVHLSFNKWLSKQRLLVGLTIQYRFKTIQLPLATIQATYTGNKNVFAGVQLQYGGYGGLHAGVKAGIKIGQRFLVEAGTQYLDGLLAGKSRGGQGLYVRLGAMLF